MSASESTQGHGPVEKAGGKAPRFGLLAPHVGGVRPGWEHLAPQAV